MCVCDVLYSHWCVCVCVMCCTAIGVYVCVYDVLYSHWCWDVAMSGFLDVCVYVCVCVMCCTAVGVGMWVS